MNLYIFYNLINKTSILKSKKSIIKFNKNILKLFIYFIKLKYIRF